MSTSWGDQMNSVFANAILAILESSQGGTLADLRRFLIEKAYRNTFLKTVSDPNIIYYWQKEYPLLKSSSQGLIGAENSCLLGTVIVSKIYQSALARQAKDKDKRHDFFLYVDEFQNFICLSMAGILSGARKYNLGLILAHQNMQQLQKYDNELASAVISNVGTRICFRI